MTIDHEPNAADLAARKAALRIGLRATRKAAAAANPDAGVALAARFPFELLGPGLVAAYWPLGSEIDARPLIERLVFSSAIISLPRVTAREGGVAFHLWRPGEPLAPDAFGLMAPSADAPQAPIPRLILCPLLAFDRAGGRLGQGGGHYDRLLAQAKPVGAVACGLAFAAQEMREVPMGDLDQRLDWIVTEREAIEVKA